MNRIYPLGVAVAVAMFAAAPFLVMGAPDMDVANATPGVLLSYKIFFFHVPSAMVMFLSAFVCGIASAFYLFRRNAAADRWAAAAAELTVVFGLIVLITGPLWARKAWGVWWQWDARLTSTLLMWMIFVAYLLVRRFGGAGAEKLAAAMAVFGMANVPFVYISVNIWRTMHPTTAVVPTLAPGMRGVFWFAVVAFMALFGLLLAARARLEARRSELEQLYLMADDEE
ncbi:MAG TPA: cytochrome c biogenesis protein CcsA [Vicinamibacterales bacterium]|nr:cytochrome c biogenesis protein CcsA [Vicinamibacterales bacterium]